MRKLHWTPVTMNLDDTIWASVPEMNSDFHEFLDLFQNKPRSSLKGKIIHASKRDFIAHFFGASRGASPERSKKDWVLRHNFFARLFFIGNRREKSFGP